MRRLLTVVEVGIVVVVAIAGCSTSGSAAAKDVTVTACSASATGGHPTASGRILNHSSKPSLYTIHVKFTDASGNGVGDGLAAVAKVGAGATATWHATGALNAKGPVTCKLSSVTRNVSP
jgi:hypothetical protein